MCIYLYINSAAYESNEMKKNSVYSLTHRQIDEKKTFFLDFISMVFFSFSSFFFAIKIYITYLF